jgi:3-methylcrotonyl-CoA carboxylase alpha subunit
MIRKLLIANRGEIACRVIRTARRQGVTTVAVYSDADADALHVAMADEAVHIGPAPAAQSYLDAEAVLAAARECGADAVHPGYGFLSENAAFATACEKAGVCFVGPPAAAITAMGSKREALVLMEQHGIPVLPGYRGEAQDDEALLQAASAVGFPLIIKPSAGGGGKGMQVAHDADEFTAVLPATRRVARAAFGDETLILERYLERPRHVEIQVFADAHGNCVHLFERDCSVQRRHQKVVEEAPAPDLPSDVRERMGEAAVNAARAIGYRGAGTVEFLYDDASGGFHFMEMNTRLQVEHPVTEMITGIDLVEWQLAVAGGAALPLTQEQLAVAGHAIEVRLYAEDPDREFLPATGPIQWFEVPEGVRVDSGVQAGDTVGVHYDPMIAKLVVHGASRPQALASLRQALSATRIGPLTSNLGFLRALADHPQWSDAAVDTGFLGRNSEALGSRRMCADDALLGAAVWQAGEAPSARTSPWDTLRGLRVNLPACQRLRLGHDGDVTDVRMEPDGDTMTVHLPSGPRMVSRIQRSATAVRFRVDRKEHRIAVNRAAGTLYLDDGRASAQISVMPVATPSEGALLHGAGTLTAPMPGRVVSVSVSPGDRVEAGQPLVVLEAMKMEHTLKAPAAGNVEQVGCTEGVQVDEGAVLVSLTLD